ncbi:MAG TPA: hypothetical protein VFE12_05045 [Acetobacteraceae bacterium]|jgi:hypothetical protein|nr:hypothetical protein [Acetobacteraceae bacterium]
MPYPQPNPGRDGIAAALMNIAQPPPQMPQQSPSQVAPTLPMQPPPVMPTPQPSPIPQQGTPMPPPFAPQGMPGQGTPLPGAPPMSLPIAPRMPPQGQGY